MSVCKCFHAVCFGNPLPPRVRKLLMYTRHFQKLSLLLIKLGLIVYLIKITIFLKDSYSYTLITYATEYTMMPESLYEGNWVTPPIIHKIYVRGHHTHFDTHVYKYVMILSDHTVDIWRTEFCLAILLPFLTNSFELTNK